MLTFNDVKTFLTNGLTALGRETLQPAGAAPRTLPLFDPGPVSLTSLQKKSPGPIVFAEVGNGAGIVLENLYDQVFINIRVLGPQNDYDGAERLAYEIDRLFLSLDGNGTIGNTRVLYVARTGGAPQLIDFDESQRYHFQTTYITPAQTGL